VPLLVQRRRLTEQHEAFYPDAPPSRLGPSAPAHLPSTVPLSVLCSAYAAGLVGP
jgi:hypothetical protein